MKHELAHECLRKLQLTITAARLTDGAIRTWPRQVLCLERLALAGRLGRDGVHAIALLERVNSLQECC